MSMRDTQEPRYQAGWDVHWIQARKAMEDRDAWQVGKLVHIGTDTIDVEVEGIVKRYICHRAPGISAAIAAGEPLGGDQPTVTVIERWSVLLLPLGPKGTPPPSRIGFLTGVARLEGGAAVEVLSPGSGYQLKLYNIILPDQRSVHSDTES
jgi:hypothetical protein